MKNSLIRVLISLFLCCCLVLNVISLPARALDLLTVGYAAIAVTVGVACIFQALGFMAAANSTDFNYTVNSCADYLTQNTTYVRDGKLTFAGYLATVDSVLTSYAPADLVQVVWQWLFDSDTVYTTPSFVNSGTVSVNNTEYSISVNSGSEFLPVVFGVKWGSSYTYNYAILSTSSGAVINDKSYSNYSKYGSYYYGLIKQVDYEKLPSVGFVDLGLFDSFPSNFDSYVSSLNLGSVSSSFDISLDQIESPFQTVGTEEEIIEIEIAPIYIDWTQTGKEFPDPNNPDDDPDQDGKFPMWLPTGLPSPSYDDSVITQNQQQAQTGTVTGDITFVPSTSDPGSGDTGTGTGTNLSEVITAITNLPSTIVSKISDFFTPSGDITMYSLDLKDLFPFCIPFDIYDFLAALSADPVPPVFEFDLNLGVATEPMKIDLSNWSDLAAIIRTLELGLFCVGLALKTRELIGG